MFVESVNIREHKVTRSGCTAHIGYFVPLTKIADFLRAGVEVTVLLAGEYHAMCESYGRSDVYAQMFMLSWIT